MRSAVLLAGFTLFAACLTVHIVVWRLGRPRSDVRALFLILLIGPAIGGVGLLGTVALLTPGGAFPTPLDVAAILLLHATLASAYVQTYPAVQAQSPSLEIAYAIGRSMPRGLSREEILARFGPGALVAARVDDLVANRLVRADGDHFTLTPASTRLIRAFLAFRALLGLPRQGG
jgi:hypothetical protein